MCCSGHSLQCPQHSPGVRALVGQVFLTDTSDVCFCWCPMVSLQPDCSLWPYLRSAFWQGVRGDFDLVCTSASYKKLSSFITHDFKNSEFFFFWNCIWFSFKLQLKSSWRALHCCTAGSIRCIVTSIRSRSPSLCPCNCNLQLKQDFPLCRLLWDEPNPRGFRGSVGAEHSLAALALLPQAGEAVTCSAGIWAPALPPDWVLLLSPWSLSWQAL